LNSRPLGGGDCSMGSRQHHVDQEQFRHQRSGLWRGDMSPAGHKTKAQCSHSTTTSDQDLSSTDHPYTNRHPLALLIAIFAITGWA
jgi:hypothetical protein